MSKVRVNAFSISLDGYGAGPDQGLEDPLGKGGMDLHAWFHPTKTFQKMFGNDEGTGGADDVFAAASMENIGAWIMGRNMFGPQRGAWADDTWKGWWGDNPPYHTDVFVLSHHPRASIAMDGGTVFHFVTGGIHQALEKARASAGAKDIRIGGGAATIRAYLKAGLIDEMHIAVAPVVLGGGEPLLAGIDLKACGLDHVRYVPSENAAHYVLSRSRS